MISIIIPTLQEESVIQKTLESLKDFHAMPHEIIVSDGGSTDKTVEIAKNYADKVVTYEDKKRQGIAKGRNAGAKVASGDFLVFMDADCSVENPDDFFVRAVNQFNDKRLSGLACWIRVERDKETLADRIIFFFDNFYQFIYNNFFHVGAARGEFQMMGKDTFTKLGGYNESLVACEDVDMFGRLAKIGMTRLDPHLIMFHTGRRAHVIGWPRLLSQWFFNYISMMFFGKSYSKEWKIIR